MSEMRITKAITDRVIKWLVRYPHLRSNDNKLIATMWLEDVQGYTVNNARDFLQLVADGKLTKPESIRRSRQKAQEDNPDLRGANYEARQAHQEVIQMDLGYK